MLKKLFGGIRMTWPRLILFAALSGVVTALIALLVPDGNSIRQIAVTFEAWIVLAIIIAVNCEKPLEAACKTFVYFLISQPLVYLIQVPFHSMGWKLFGYYTIYLRRFIPNEKGNRSDACHDDGSASCIRGDGGRSAGKRNVRLHEERKSAAGPFQHEFG